MSFSNSNDKKGLFTEINITPLTDIFLVLLIIMMVIAPSFQSVDNNIEIPEINSGVSIEQKKVEIAVTKQGQFYINGNPVSGENLVVELNKIKGDTEKPEVIVKADTATKSSEIQKIMKAAQQAEYSKLVIAGEPLSKKEQKQLSESKQISATDKKVTNTSQNTDWDE